MYIDKREFDEFVFRNRFNKHWAANIDRWEYHEKVIALLETIKYNSALEAGTMGASICNISDTIDFNQPDKGWPLLYTPTYNHDLLNIPWPVTDKQYDVFIALRVFQYFHHKSEECMMEMSRIANHIILALPEKYAHPYRLYHRINKTIACEKSDTVILYYNLT